MDQAFMACVIAEFNVEEPLTAIDVIRLTKKALFHVGVKNPEMIIRIIESLVRECYFPLLPGIREEIDVLLKYNLVLPIANEIKIRKFCF
jgi:hypothetical protein